MRRFHDLSISRKLLLAFGSLLVLITLLGASTVYLFGMVRQSTAQIEDRWLPGAQLASMLKANAAEYRVAELRHVQSEDSPMMDHYEADMAQVLAKLQKHADEYARLPSSPESQALWAQASQTWSEYLVESKALVAKSRAGEKREANELSGGVSMQRFAQAVDELNQLAELNAAGGRTAVESTGAVYQKARLAILTVVAVAISLGLAMAVWMARAISGNLREAVRVAQTVAAGDLRVDIQARSRDESGQLLLALKEMVGSLSSIVGQVREASQNIATGASEIAYGNSDLSQRTEQQASSLQQTAAAMEQLTDTVRDNAATSEQAARLATDAAEAVRRGGDRVGQVVTTMKDISTSSRQIGEIIGVIDGIAFQTNILALNAAVEAARAGDQGRGFAVVAGEVRSLAQRSAEAARQIKSLIGASAERVEAGARQVDEAGASMQEIVEQVQKVSRMIHEISGATASQAGGLQEVGRAVTQLDTSTQQNAALVEQGAAATESLRRQADQLAELVQVFKTADSAVHGPSAAAKVDPSLAAPAAA